MKKAFLFLCFVLGSFVFAQAQDAPAKDSALQQFVGKYKFPDGSVVAEVIVALEEGALTMSSSAGTSALEKQGEDVYTIVQFQGSAKFVRDSNRRIIGVNINAMGYQLEGTKVETRPLALQKKRFIAALPVLLTK